MWALIGDNNIEHVPRDDGLWLMKVLKRILI